MKITRNTPTQLIVENNPIWLAIAVTLFALVFVAAGLAMIRTEPVAGIMMTGFAILAAVVFNIAFTRRTQLILDSTKNLIELRRRSWFGYSKMTWELRYLDRAIVEVSRSGDTNTYRAALIITGGMDAGTHPLTLVYSSGKGADRAKTAINDWSAALDSNPPTP